MCFFSSNHDLSRTPSLLAGQKEKDFLYCMQFLKVTQENNLIVARPSCASDESDEKDLNLFTRWNYPLLQLQNFSKYEPTKELQSRRG